MPQLKFAVNDGVEITADGNNVTFASPRDITSVARVKRNLTVKNYKGLSSPHLYTDVVLNNVMGNCEDKCFVPETLSVRLSISGSPKNADVIAVMLQAMKANIDKLIESNVHKGYAPTTPLSVAAPTEQNQ